MSVVLCLYMMHTMDPTEQWREGLLTPYNPWPDMLIIYSDTAQFYSVSKHVHILVRQNGTEHVTFSAYLYSVMKTKNHRLCEQFNNLKYLFSTNRHYIWYIILHLYISYKNKKYYSLLLTGPS